ncbi:protein furry [Eurytemora carolleeae]|uniref:protein furry n=1 Tax=Eurytemora carolleeae TaxID=1294199 RepID=UPI000C7701C5|nr:protein furry [Eurytemora carolleeae]|eukprot:XP_023347388.1 protein furry-like [Eurytemora affinis]
MILLTDLVVDGLDLDCHSVDWSVHLPLMLHIIFLGLDNNRPIVHQHCKQLLLNLLVVLGAHGDHLSVASILLGNKTAQLNYGLTHTNSTALTHNFLEEDENFDAYLTQNPQSQKDEEESDEDEESEASGGSGSVTSGHGSMSSSRSSGVTFALPPPTLTVPEVMKALIQFIASKKTEGVLWLYEDTTKSLSTVKSGEQMGVFLTHVLRALEESLPHAHLAERWAQLSIQLALSCSSRHYAGRSLQIFRALRVPIYYSFYICTVVEQGEDMQGYVTELILTLEAVVENLDSDFRPMDIMREIFKSTPNLKEAGGDRRVGLGTPSPQQHAYHASAPPAGPYHARSTSYGLSHQQYRRANADSPGVGEPRGRSSTESEAKIKSQTNLARSRSAQSLKVQDMTSEEDKMNILVQLFWICIAVLESDYEHEFILGLRLLDKVLSKLPLDRPDTREKVEKILSGLKWSQFPGLHSLLLKGCTNPNTYEPTIALLSRMTLQLDFPVVDPGQSHAFPMNVIALLPYLVMNYEDANDLCITSAKNIAHVSCVVKYLYDSYSHLSLPMLGFLVEVLEKGPPSVQPSVLTIIHCMAHYVDLQSTTHTINSDLMRAVSKFVETPHWKEALKILKLAVTRSSTLVAPPSSGQTPSMQMWEASFVDTDSYLKKELPGRTMEFTFDLSQTPVIERRHRRGHAVYLEDGNTSSPRRSLSLSTADSATFSGWKRPWMSQSRVRECLVNLLNVCGQKVGLPKSPSVIFSQTSELLERQSSMASSTECVSGPGNDVSTEQSKHDTTDTEQKFGMYMRDFDFLEYELESLEGESVDNFNWGVRRPSITNLEEGGTGAVSPLGFNPGGRLPIRRRAPGGVGAEESSDDEVESVRY